MNNIICLFKEVGICIDWGSSDGFSSHKTFLKQIKVKHPEYTHFFDVVHILKNLRNFLLNKFINDSSNVSFSMQTLCNLRNSANQETRKLFRKLLSQDPYPTDKMEMKMVDMLLSNELFEALRSQNSPAAVSLAKYLESMYFLYEGFMNNNLEKDH